MFTVRFAPSPYITGTFIVFKGLKGHLFKVGLPDVMDASRHRRLTRMFFVAEALATLTF